MLNLKFRLALLTFTFPFFANAKTAVDFCTPLLRAPVLLADEQQLVNQFWSRMKAPSAQGPFADFIAQNAGAPRQVERKDRKPAILVRQDGRWILQRVWTYWNSRWAIRDGAQQGYITDTLRLLGPELSALLGIRVIDNDHIDVTDFFDQEFLDRAVLKLREKTGLFFPRIRIMDRECSSRELIESYRNKELVIAKNDDVLLHDLNYHFLHFFLGHHYWKLLSAHAANALLIVDHATAISYFGSYDSLQYLLWTPNGRGGIIRLGTFKQDLDRLADHYDTLTGNLQATFLIRAGWTYARALAFNLDLVGWPVHLDCGGYTGRKCQFLTQIRQAYLADPRRQDLNSPPAYLGQPSATQARGQARDVRDTIALHVEQAAVAARAR